MARRIPYNILTVSENQAAYIRANDVVERLAAQLRPTYEVHCEVWGFEQLANSALCGFVENDARTADMIIFTASGHTRLPAHIQRWLENWARARRVGQAALVALLDQSPVFGPSAFLEAYLRRLAESNGLQYFCNSEQPLPQAIGNDLTGAGTLLPEALAPRKLEALLHEPPPQWAGWGINE